MHDLTAPDEDITAPTALETARLEILHDPACILGLKLTKQWDDENGVNLGDFPGTITKTYPRAHNERVWEVLFEDGTIDLIRWFEHSVLPLFYSIPSVEPFVRTQESRSS